jgi:hypothetical protein
MKFRLFKIIIVIFAIITAINFYVKEFHVDKTTYRRKNLSFSSKYLDKNPNYPFNYDFLLTRPPVQLLSAQHYRSTHYAQGLYNRLNTYTISVNYLNFICGRGNSGLSHFRRLILFPFHDFW